MNGGVANQQSGEAVAELIKRYPAGEEGERALLEELASRTVAIGDDPQPAGKYNPEVTIDQQEMGLEDLAILGRRILGRLERELHAVVCGGGKDDKEDRESILSAVGAGDVALGTILYGVLVTSFGLAPAVATVVAALLIKRVLAPAGNEVCKFWGERLAEGN